MKVLLKEHEKLEKKETPAFEVKEHSKGFLKKGCEDGGKAQSDHCREYC